ncbi:Peroxiredoxin [Candidatus Hepatincolaceae symbiont of Richtersius coronifer]
MLKIGDSFPQFSLAGIDGNGVEREFSNRDFIGKPLVVYFYPKDDTSGCTTQACAFNAALPRVHNGAQIVGISGDSVESHKKFLTKHKLTFPLLTDEGHILTKKVGAIKEGIVGKLIEVPFLDPMSIARTTFLLDKNGKVVHIWEKVEVSGHDQAVLFELERLEKSNQIL